MKWVLTHPTFKHPPVEVRCRSAIRGVRDRSLPGLRESWELNRASGRQISGFSTSNWPLVDYWLINTPARLLGSTNAPNGEAFIESVNRRRNFESMGARALIFLAHPGRNSLILPVWHFHFTGQRTTKHGCHSERCLARIRAQRS